MIKEKPNYNIEINVPKLVPRISIVFLEALFIIDIRSYKHQSYRDENLSLTTR